MAAAAAKPTVTDADVQLGRVCAETFAGGAFALDLEAAQDALQDGVGKVLGLEPALAAFGISEVVDENMAAAARAHAAEFGMDLASRDMVAFGGAAPLHAARLGEKLGVRRIIVPSEAGVGSAVGFLLAPVAYEVVRSRRQRLSALDHELVNRLMQRNAGRNPWPWLPWARRRTGCWKSVMPICATLARVMKSSWHCRLNFMTRRTGAVFREAFEAAYTRLYGRVMAGIDIEVLSWTLTVSEPARHVCFHHRTRRCPQPRAMPGRQALFDPGGECVVEAQVYLREALHPGDRVEGPALITEDQTTTVITSAWVATIDNRGHIVLERRP